MNIFTKLSIRNLKKNKTRTFVTIIGIILSTAMFMAVTTLISSVHHFMKEYYIYNDGSWHGSVWTNYNEVNNFSSNKKIKETVYMEQIGFAKLDYSKNNLKPYLFVGGMSENFTNLMPVHITKGCMPKNSNEIIIPEHLKKNSREFYNIGDVIELNIGNRLLNGEVLNNDEEYVFDESLDIIMEKFLVLESRTYTIVGFYEEPSFEKYSAPGYTALTISDKDEENIYKIYFQMNKISETAEFVNSIETDGTYDTIYGKTGLNYSLLRLYGSSNENSYNRVLTGLGTVIISIIMFGSIALIYNSFSISVNERTKQFGILSSIGATRKQIKQSVLTEGVILGIIGIPVGIISGIIGIGITLNIIGGKRISSVIMGENNVPLTLYTSVWAVVIAAVIAFVTILISAYIPARRAMKKTAIDSIRQNDDIKLNKRRVKTSKLTKVLFGLEGTLAQKNFKRNHKKYRATIISLFVSIVLFISASSFCSYLKKSYSSIYEDYAYNMELYFYDLLPDNDEIKNNILECKAVDYAAYSSVLHVNEIREKRNFNRRFLNYYTDEYLNLNEVLVVYDLVFVNDEEFKKYLAENNIDSEEYFKEGINKAIFLNSISGWSSDEQRYINYPVFDLFEDSQFNLKSNNNKREYTILLECDTTVEKPIEFAYTNKYRPTFYMPYSKIDEVAGVLQEDGTVNDKIKLSDTEYVFYYINSTQHEESEKSIVTYLDESLKGYYEYSLYDYADSIERDKMMLLMVNVFSYGFIVLISLIAVANVFNTISTNVNLRRKEFAMLRSVGMAQGEMYKMMNYECIMYGLKSLLFGLPVSVAITRVIYNIVDDGVEMSFFIPWQSIVIALVSVFLVVFSTMMYSMKKIKNENMVDALRNDNL